MTEEADASGEGAVEPAEAARAGRRRWVAAVKVAFGLGLLAVLVAQVEPDRILAVLRAVDPALLTAGLLCFASTALVRSVRLLAIAGGLLGIRDALWLAFVSMFLGNVLPSVGSDAYVVSVLTRLSSFGRATAIVLADRLLGLGALLLAALAAGLLDPSAAAVLLEVPIRPPVTVPAWALALVGGVLAAAGAFVCWRVPRLGERLRTFGRQVGGAAVGGRRLAAAGACAAAFQALRIAGFGWLLAACGEPLRVGAVVVLLAFTAVVSILPLSPGSVGVREGAMVLYASAAGVDPAAAAAAALLTRLVLWAQALVGGALFLAGRAPAPAATRG